MASKGTLAKDNLINQLIAVSGNNYIGCIDKKYYFWADDGGEKVQVAVSMTCPKTPVGDIPPAADNSGFAIPVISTPVQTAEISPDERKTIADLMERLGL